MNRRSRRALRLGIALAVTLVVTVFATVSISPVSALERGSRLAPDPPTIPPDEDWNVRGTTSTAYYNFCTGWVWTWSGFAPEARFGGTIDFPENAETLDRTFTYFFSGPPPGYGYTGAISVHGVDPVNCPTDPPLVTRPFLPATGWHVEQWGVDGGPLALVITLGTAVNSHGNIPIELATDHPAPGPTGPIACGTCYPTTREHHSFYWGTVGESWCPALSFHDGFCAAEILMAATFSGVPTSVEDVTWGRLKALYR